MRRYDPRAVAAILICADSMRSPELRHEVPLAVPDELLYVEQDGRRVVVVASLETERIRAVDPGLEVLPFDAFGIDDLLAEGTTFAEATLEVYTRACRELGVSSAASHARCARRRPSSSVGLLLRRRRAKSSRSGVSSMP